MHAKIFVSSKILPVMVSWNCWHSLNFSMGGSWDLTLCDGSKPADKIFQAQLGDSFKGNLTVTPLYSFESTSKYTVAGPGDEIIGWYILGKGNKENNTKVNKASVTVWYVEYDKPYYFDNIYPVHNYEKVGANPYPLS